MFISTRTGKMIGTDDNANGRVISGCDIFSIKFIRRDWIAAAQSFAGTATTGFRLNKALDRMRLLFLAMVLILLSVFVARSVSAESPTITTQLHPGNNYVGWIAQATPPAELFAQIPEAVLIYTWDASELRFRFSLPAGLGSLKELVPGMGLVVRIGGPDGVSWRRPTTQLRRQVPLEAGWNLLAWSGADDTELSVLRQHIPGVRNLIAGPGVRRLETGDAVWVETTQAGRWVQDQTVVPLTLLPGVESSRVRQRAAEDVLRTTEFFDEHFGLAVPGMTFYLPIDCESLVEASLPRHVAEHQATCGSVGLYAAGGWAGPDYVVAMLFPGVDWYDPANNPGKSNFELFVHEYTHSLQSQLRAGGSSRGPAWLIEGMADWLAKWSELNALRKGEPIWGITSTRLVARPPWDARQGLIGEGTWDAERESWRRVLFDSRTPSLRSTEVYGELGGIEYELGIEAVELLVQRAGVRSLFDFWRNLAPKMIGPNEDWVSRLDWHQAFEQAFGLTAVDFYADFEKWRHEQAQGRRYARLGYPVIQGRLFDHAGRPLSDAKVQLVPERGWDTRGEWSYTLEDGSYTTIASHHDHEYKYEITLENGCQAVYGSSGWAFSIEEAAPLRFDWVPIDPDLLTEESDGGHDALLAVDGVSDLHLQVPARICDPTVRRVQGSVRGPENQPLPGIVVHWRSDARHGLATTDFEGEFEILGRDHEEFNLTLELAEDCYYEYFSGKFVESRATNDSTQLPIAGADVHLPVLRIPADACS